MKVLIFLTFLSSLITFAQVPQRYLSEIDSSWKKIVEKKNVHIYQQKKKNSRFMAFRGVTVINAPILSVLQVLRNVKTAPNWTPRLKEKKIVKVYSYLDAVTYNHNNLTWPVSDRDLVIRSTLTYDIKTHKVIVKTYSVNDPKVPLRKDRVRATIHHSTLILKKMGQQTFLDLDIHFDPKGLLPSWLVNMLQKTWPYKFLKNLERESQNFKGPIAQEFRDIINKMSVSQKITKDL